MARLRSICIPMLLGSAIISRSAAAQAGSVSLTHTVSVTVPALLKVKVANGAAPAKESRRRTSQGLALSINSTRAWSLSMEAPQHSRLQWSRDGEPGFSTLGGGQRGITSGALAPIATATRIFVRSVTEDSEESSSTESDTQPAVLLTIVAQ
jgi:hypothetical protein